MSDTETEPQPEPEPEPETETEQTSRAEPEQDGEQPQALEADSFGQVEKMAKSLDLLGKHVAKRMGEILGDDVVNFEECELCTFWGTPGWRRSGPLPEAVEDALFVALKQSSPRELLKDEYSNPCQKCGGWGVVRTDAKVQGQEALPCLTCKGMGWVPVGPERATGAFATINGPAAQPPAAPQPAQTSEPEPPDVVAARALLTSRGMAVIAPLIPTG